MCSISRCFTLTVIRLAPDVLDPFIVAEDPQRLGDRLVDAAGTNFNRMFNFLKIEAGHFARLQSHTDGLIIFVFSSPSGPPEKAPFLSLSKLNGVDPSTLIGVLFGYGATNWAPGRRPQTGA